MFAQVCQSLSNGPCTPSMASPFPIAKCKTWQRQRNPLVRLDLTFSITVGLKAQIINEKTCAILQKINAFSR